jgi:hypothetical protein
MTERVRLMRRWHHRVFGAAVGVIACVVAGCGGADEDLADGGEAFATTSAALGGAPGVHSGNSVGPTYLYSTTAAPSGTSTSSGTSPSPAPAASSPTSGNNAGNPQTATGSQASPDPIPAVGNDAPDALGPGTTHH